MVYGVYNDSAKVTWSPNKIFLVSVVSLCAVLHLTFRIHGTGRDQGLGQLLTNALLPGGRSVP